MTKEEQIKEMVKVMNECCNIYDEQGRHIRNKCYECECWCDTNHVCCSYNTKEATALYEAGYRKASEIFEEIKRETKNHGIAYTLRKIAELKKKYTESEDTNDTHRQ